MPIVPAGAVFIKPVWQVSARKNKFFRDEKDFLSVETSLESETEENEDEKAEKVFSDEEIELENMIGRQKKLTRSTTEQDNFLVPHSKLFLLSQLPEVNET